MYKKERSIIIQDKTYNIIYCDLLALLYSCKLNKVFHDSLLKIMNAHRKKFDIYDFCIEYLRNREKKKVKLKFLLICDRDSIISISRIFYDMKKRSGYLSAVHTLELYRGKSLCQTNIKHLIKFTNKRSGIIRFELHVDVNNIPAIKCYTKCGFKIVETLQDKYGNNHVMVHSVK